MKSAIFFCLFFFNAHLLSSTSTPKKSINSDLLKLAGVWKAHAYAKTIFESWTLINEHELSGFSYALKGKDTIVFEQTRILESGQETNYLAIVRGENEGKEVAFKMISIANKTFVFENPKHDFPQRVIYQFIGSDSLHAWVEGIHQGKNSREDFYYKRQQ
jgi:hypothetical protein